MSGIAIMGLNGAGKSTIAHALAKRLGYYELDVEDCYFPEQSESRLWSLENDSIIETKHLGQLPFSEPRKSAEVEENIINSIKANPDFIISGVTMNWSTEITDKIDIVFCVITPVEERVKRVISRERKRFGDRVTEGGDMFSQQMEFKRFVEAKDSQVVRQSIENLDCPVIYIDGTIPTSQSIEIIIDKIRNEIEE